MRRAAAWFLAVLAFVTGGGTTTASTGSSARMAVPAARPCAGARPPRRYDHVVLLVMENHGFSEIAGHSPFLNRLARSCGLATNYRAVAHPSLPNYLALTSGDTHGITSDCTNCTVSGPSLFGQLRGDWRSYLQSLPSTGFTGASSGGYAKKHNPAAYYKRIAAAYARDAVPLRELLSDLAHDRLARFSLVVPDLCADEHNCPVASGDAWLETWLPRILASSAYRSGRTAVFVTYDEDSGGGNRVYAVVAAPSVRPHTVVASPLGHYSLLGTVEGLLGLPCLAHACGAPSMAAPFHLAP